MTDIVESVHNGTWNSQPGQEWGYGLAEGGVKLAPFSNLVPGNVRSLVDEKTRGDHAEKTGNISRHER